MIVKFDMNAEEAEKAESFLNLNLLSFFKDCEGKYFTSSRMIELMKYNEVGLSIIEEIASEKVRLFHDLPQNDYDTCTRYDDDLLRAFGYANGFDVLIHIDEKAISEHANELQKLGSRFFNLGSYIWCGFNSKHDDLTTIYNLLLKLFREKSEQMIKSI